jgi:hypothetical protein
MWFGFCLNYYNICKISLPITDKNLNITETQPNAVPGLRQHNSNMHRMHDPMAVKVTE